MTNPPKHKTDFSQRKSSKLEPQNPHKVENISLTDTNVKRDIRNVFFVIQMSQIRKVNSQILHRRSDNTRRSPRARCPVQSHAPFRPDQGYLFDLPDLGHGISRLARNVKRYVKGELVQELPGFHFPRALSKSRTVFCKAISLSLSQCSTTAPNGHNGPSPPNSM